MLQNRVDMTKTKTIRNVKQKQQNENLRSDFYVTNEEDGIRPYALLIKITGEDGCCCSIS